MEDAASGWALAVHADAAAAGPAASALHHGLVTNLLNPKIAILYVSLLPQFIEPSRGHVAAQSLLLGLTQIAVALTVNALIVLTAGGIAGFFARRPLWLRVQRLMMGTVLAALAVRIAADRSRAAVAMP